MDRPTEKDKDQLADSLHQAARCGDLDDLLSLLATVTTAPRSEAAAENAPSLEVASVLAAPDPLSGNTCLHFASANGHVHVVLALLQHGAPVDALNQSESTALHYAALTGQVHVVRALLDNGASPVVENTFHRTALDEALRKPHRDVADLLIAFVENKVASSPNSEPM